MTTTITAAGVTTTEIDGRDSGHGAGVSWPAIFAGAAAAAALSMILVVLGAGLGFASTSPWTANAGTAKALGGAAIAWITFMSIAASAVGGYLAGRLRSHWAGVHEDEVYFRDTAHGLLAWAVASLVTAAFLTSAIGGALSGAAQAGGAALKGAATVATTAATTAAASSGGGDSAISGGPTPYFVDTLFRSDTPVADPNDSQSRAEITRIFLTDMKNGTMGPADVRYIGQVVARRTGLAPAEAEKRVSDAFTQASTAIANAENQARQLADDARKAAAAASLWMFVALLAGAFCASLAALSGGRRRDSFV